MPLIVDKTLRDAPVKIYAAILEAWRDHGESPTKRELAHATGYSSTTVQQAVDVLRRKGYLHAPKFAVRSLVPVDGEVTLANTEPDPWETLSETKFWKPKDWSK